MRTVSPPVGYDVLTATTISTTPRVIILDTNVLIEFEHYLARGGSFKPSRREQVQSLLHYLCGKDVVISFAALESAQSIQGTVFDASNWERMIVAAGQLDALHAAQVGCPLATKPGAGPNRTNVG